MPPECRSRRICRRLTATISNNQNVMVAAKNNVGPLRLFAGYEWYQLAPPSDPVNTVTGFTNIGGLPMGTAYANLTAISNTRLFNCVAAPAPDAATRSCK